MTIDFIGIVNYNIVDIERERGAAMNIRDLARLAGVSPSTVSKVINGKDNSISAATRERVLNLVKEYNYQAYSAAMDSGSKSFILGVLLKSFE